MPASRPEAARFLTRATFDATDAKVDHLMSVSYSAWIDEQFASPRPVIWHSGMRRRREQGDPQHGPGQHSPRVLAQRDQR
jgi:hypothetical protein